MCIRDSYRTVLRTLAMQLPRGGDDSVGAAINRFLERAPADGADFHCDADFVRLRARQELIRIEQRLIGETEDPREPQACYTTPFVVDVARILGCLLYTSDAADER